MNRSALRPSAAALLVLGLGGIGGAVPAAWSDPASLDPSAPAAGKVAPMCGIYDELRRFLGQRFAERPLSSGLADDGTVVQVFASSREGTWTLVSVDPSGDACVLATGQAWQQEARSRQGEPA